jgi:hypothetical protein
MSNTDPKHSLSAELEQDSLSLKWAAVSILFVSVVIAILIGIFAGMDAIRQQQVVKETTNTARQFVAQNYGKVESLFTKTFDECATDLQTQLNLDPNNEGVGRWSSFPCAKAKDAFNQLNKEAIKDFPSTGFLRVQGQNVDLIEASGDYFKSQPIKQIYQLSHQDDLEAYLFRGESIRRWNTFLNYMQQRQVIVPIEQNGKVLGYMFIGVIEK